jgi:HlyD family secretion protein
MSPNQATQNATPETQPPAGPRPPPDVKAVLAESNAERWYRRPWVWVLMAATLLGLVALAWWWSGRAARAAPQYVTQPVTRGTLTLHVSANGTLQPTRSINIGSELSGSVLKVNVDVNDRVRKGQVLLELDTAKLGNQILRSRAAVASAGARQAQAKATRLEAQAGLKRLELVAKLSGGQVPALAELDAAHAAQARALAEEVNAAAGLKDALAALATDGINLNKASIRAPADGVVLTRNVDPGNAVAATLQAVTLFTLAEDLTRLRLWVYVDEADVGSVSVGQSASFTVSAYPARPYPARITRVGFGSTITDNVVTYLTYLDVDNTDLSLRPGMTATATITATEHRNVLMVPNAALRFEPTAAAASAKKGLGSGLMVGPPRTPRTPAAERGSTANAKRVWVLDAEGVPQAVAITPGLSDGRLTEITAGALKEGMQVVTAQKSAVKP